MSISQDADLTDSPITYYLIKNLTTGITTKVARAPLANLTQIHIWNLSAQTQYTFTITAVSADGISATSSVSGAITTPHAPAAPVSTPAFTLSASSESRAANSAATGFSINSTGGAIASFAISPAAPAGMSFSTTTGAFTGTPTTVAAATVYTVTGTNATGSANATFTFTVTAAVVVASYFIGDVGPGGGRIFYYLAAGFNCGAGFTSTGSPTGGQCHYLEASPVTLSGYWTVAKYAWSGNTSESIGTTSTEIGAGYKNTLAIVNQSGGGNTAGMAGTASREYRGPNNLIDWYLPSQAELNQLWEQRNSQEESVSDWHWSSSENSGAPATSALMQSFSDGEQDTNSKSDAVGAYVRPIRAF